jgi:hypothetical protein
MPSRDRRSGRNGWKQPASAPGHSGGAVPDSHRSSLFAGDGQLPTTGHQSRRECIGPGTEVNACGRRPHDPQSLPAAPRLLVNLADGVRSAREAVTVARRRAARPLRPCLRGSLDATRTCDSPSKKRGELAQAVGATPPIATSVPRGITVPVGQPGGGSNLRSLESRTGSTGLPRKSSWITTSG